MFAPWQATQAWVDHQEVSAEPETIANAIDDALRLDRETCEDLFPVDGRAVRPAETPTGEMGCHGNSTAGVPLIVEAQREMRGWSLTRCWVGSREAACSRLSEAIARAEAEDKGRILVEQVKGFIEGSMRELTRSR